MKTNMCLTNIFKITSDFCYKDFTGDCSVFNKFNSFKGQLLKDSWTLLPFTTLENVDKKQGADARCYGSILLIKNTFKNTFESFLKDEVEILSISVDNDRDLFSYVNVINVVNAINLDSMSNQDIMKMLRGNEIDFRLDSIKEEVIFRDRKITSNYFCTSKFKEFVSSINLTGLRFEQVGIAR